MMLKRVFLLSIFLLLIALLNFLYNPLKSAQALVALDNYCRDGYYYVNPNNSSEVSCSRAPLCGGKGYDEVANLAMPNPQACMGDGTAERSTKGCAGLVPLCCYEVERTGDPLKCVGYWERLWCHPQQCAAINPELGRACNNGNPGTCNCGVSISSWCSSDGVQNIPYIPIETRLGFQATNTPIPSPTSTPLPTVTGITLPTVTPTRTPTPTTAPIPTTTCTTANNASITFAFQPDRVRNVVNFNNSGGLTLLAVNNTQQCSFTRNNIFIVYNNTGQGGDFWTELPVSLPSGNYSFYLSGPRNIRQQFNGIALSPNQNLDCRTTNATGCGDLGNLNIRVTKMLATGDANRDNVINSIDYELYRVKVGQAGSGNNSDFDYNNSVEFTNGNNDDFLHFKNNFGKKGV